MEISLQRWPSKFGFFALCLFLTFFFVAAILRPWLAERAAAPLTADGLKRAVALEPTNAKYRFLSGRHVLMAEQDAARSINQYRVAVALNPYSTRSLLDLARVYQVTGDEAQQSVMLHRALAADPYDVDVNWEAGVFFLARGEISNALRQFRVVVAQADPNQTSAAFQLAWRATHDVNRIMREVDPPTIPACAAFLKVLIDNKEPAAAAVVWERWMALKQSFLPQLAFPYIQFLLTEHQPQDAAAVWKYLEQVSPAIRSRTSFGNLVLNGGFEEDLLNGGMDWRFSPSAATRIEVDTTQFHGANRSLKLTFQGDTTDSGLVQFIPVRPDTVYSFRGYIKAEEIFSAYGPRFGIYDAYSNLPLLLTEDVIGTVVWMERAGTFRTGPETTLVALKVVRESGHIRGRAWIDDLQIRLTPSQ